MDKKKCPVCGHEMKGKEKDRGVSNKYSVIVIHWRCTKCSHYETEYK